MTRSNPLSTSSLALGIVLGLLLFLSMGQFTSASGPKIEVIAHPRAMMQVRQGIPFVVPAGKVLIVTGLGTDQGGVSGDVVTLLVNGQHEAQTTAWRNTADQASSVAAVPLGKAVPSGSTVDVGCGNPSLSARAWGYLAEVGSTPAGEGKSICVPYSPHPRDLVQVSQGTTYTVPSGLLFVLTALGGTDAGQTSPTADHALRVNGQIEVTALDTGPFALPPLAALPTGFTVAGGSTIEVVQTAGGPSPGRAWGYLAPQ